MAPSYGQCNYSTLSHATVFFEFYIRILFVKMLRLLDFIYNQVVLPVFGYHVGWLCAVLITIMLDT